jgi:hypothetical protein
MAEFDFLQTLVSQQNFDKLECVECSVSVPVNSPPTQIIPANLPELVVEFLNEHPEFSVDAQNSQKFVRNFPSRCFLHKNDDHVHDKDGAWWVSTPDNDILVFCYRHNENLKLIPKMDRQECKTLDKSVWRRLEITDRYIGDLKTKIAHDENCALNGYTKADGFECPPCDLMVLRCPLGSGKTKSVMEYTGSDRSVLFITHRITLGKDLMVKYAGLYKFKTYEEKDWTADRLICCVNSLQSVKNPGQYSSIVIDELGSVLKQFEMKSFPRKSMEVFHTLISTHKKIIVMDGTLTDNDLSFFANIVKPKIPMLVEYTHVSNVVKTITTHTKLQTIADIAMHEVARGTNFMVAFSCSVLKIKAFCEATGIDQVPHLIIHRDNKADEVLDHALWETHQVVLYSPTIAEGVSYEGTHFTRLFGVFSKASCLPRTVAQQIGRPRLITEVDIYVDDAKKQLEILSFGKSFKKLIETCVKDDVDNTKLDFSYALWCKNTSESADEYLNFEECLYKALVKNGYLVHAGKVDNTKSDFARMFGEGLNRATQNHHIAILEATDITEETYLKMVKETHTESEACMVLKYKLQHELLLCDELTSESVPYFEDAYKIATLRNCFDLKFDQISGNSSLDIAEHLNNRILKNRAGYKTGKIFSDQKSYIVFNPHKILYLNSLAQAIGWSHLFDTKPAVGTGNLIGFLQTRNNAHLLARCSETSIGAVKTGIAEGDVGRLFRMFVRAIDCVYLTVDILNKELYMRPQLPVGLSPGTVPMVKNCSVLVGRDVESMKQFMSREKASVKDLVKCERCGKEMRGDNLPRHVKSCDAEKVLAKALVKCVKCGKEIRKSNMQRHLKNCG